LKRNVTHRDSRGKICVSHDFSLSFGSACDYIFALESAGFVRLHLTRLVTPANIGRAILALHGFANSVSTEIRVIWILARKSLPPWLFHRGVFISLRSWVDLFTTARCICPWDRAIRREISRFFNHAHILSLCPEGYLLWLPAPFPYICRRSLAEGESSDFMMIRLSLFIFCEFCGLIPTVKLLADISIRMRSDDSCKIFKSRFSGWFVFLYSFPIHYVTLNSACISRLTLNFDFDYTFRKRVLAESPAQALLFFRFRMGSLEFIALNFARDVILCSTWTSTFDIVSSERCQIFRPRESDRRCRLPQWSGISPQTI
jgi:hypothetical protein